MIGWVYQWLRVGPAEANEAEGLVRGSTQPPCDACSAKNRSPTDAIYSRDGDRNRMALSYAGFFGSLLELG